eukprot:CAMPEP_0197525184 /NCGR_PEP_ID=MMETSP1318-20131121/10669_1 /TAXON_ID=552666 /ORGANISM="Partenskyella glossopodia, Strain RCC365" /LENGTH=349 /DNA_ID=CAMNT_0043078369 /DNA_START=77 /DNA_END=1126 /DNA_ORIENTATION=+
MEEQTNPPQIIEDDYDDEDEKRNMVPTAPVQGGRNEVPVGEPIQPSDLESVSPQNVFEMDMAIILFASLVELAAAGKACSRWGKCFSEYGFAVAVGVISFCGALTYLIAHRRNNESLVPLNTAIGVFVGVYWSIAAIILTFDRPFVETGNGYYATWMAFFASFHFLYWSVPAVKNCVESLRDGRFAMWSRKVLLVIFIASVITVIAAAFVCANGPCTKAPGWAVACSTISACVVGVMLLLPSFTSRFLHWLSPILFLWWCIGTGVMTYDDPFTTSGNGYFASWAALLASSYLTYYSLFGTSYESEGPKVASRPSAGGGGMYQDNTNGAYYDDNYDQQPSNPEAFPSAEL